MEREREIRVPKGKSLVMMVPWSAEIYAVELEPAAFLYFEPRRK